MSSSLRLIDCFLVGVEFSDIILVVLLASSSSLSAVVSFSGVSSLAGDVALDACKLWESASDLEVVVFEFSMT